MNPELAFFMDKLIICLLRQVGIFPSFMDVGCHHRFQSILSAVVRKVFYLEIGVILKSATFLVTVASRSRLGAVEQRKRTAQVAIATLRPRRRMISTPPYGRYANRCSKGETSFKRCYT